MGTNRVVVSSGTLWRVATRAISVEDAVRQSIITGDRCLGEAMLSLVPIIR